MKIDGIYSMREHQSKVYADIVYEWEDALAAKLGVPVLRWGSKHQLASHVMRHVPCKDAVKNLVLSPRKRYLRYVLNALEDTPLFNHPSCVPVIIDFFVPDHRMSEFIRIYDKCEYVFITSRQVFDKLSALSLPFKIVHFPFFLADKYRLRPFETVQKKYSLTLLGAQIFDATYKEYVERYQAAHPDFEYVYKMQAGSRYISSRGITVADASTRPGYFDLVRDSKVVIYSTPGLRGRADANGYDQVTPKLLEYLASYCQVLLRYTDNSDTRFFELQKLGPNISTYQEFEAQLDKCLNSHVDRQAFDAYLDRHDINSAVAILNAI